MGVPNFVIDRFKVPIFLLPIYQAAGIQYGVPWEVLAAINEIESDYGRNLSVSSAGAVGWMQFLPSTWKRWGVDANRDGHRDPYNPPDAIFSAARYLKAAGAGRDVRTAIFAYNHAGWYVDSVMSRARVLAGYPADFVGALTGISQARFPVAGRATYPDAAKARQGIDIYAKQRAPVVAVSDGVVEKVGHSAGRGHYLVLQDVYGNRYTYSRLGSVRRVYRVPKRRGHRRGLAPLRNGSKLIGGTIIGRVGAPSGTRPAHLRFEVQPAGRSTPNIDPKPILDGWTLLASTSIYRASGNDALAGSFLPIGQVLLMPKPLLIRRVLADPRVKIYACGRRDVATGLIDQRVLATLEYLADSGLDPTVTALECGHGLMTTSGNVSEHSTGDAVDIAAINGTPILGHQGPGSIAELTVKRLMQLQGTIAPHQIISLMDFGANTLALHDHANHIHVGFKPRFGDTAAAAAQTSTLRPGQWQDLMQHLGRLVNPTVPTKPSRYALPAHGAE
jgi:murein DD-endopeptidase MepM/ murein hydrolase activator NlpD